MPRDTIEQIEKDLNQETWSVEELQIRILIQIAKELRVIAQRRGE